MGSSIKEMRKAMGRKVDLRNRRKEKKIESGCRKNKGKGREEEEDILKGEMEKGNEWKRQNKR